VVNFQLIRAPFSLRFRSHALISAIRTSRSPMRLQSGQRRLFLREPMVAGSGSQKGLALSRLRHVDWGAVHSTIRAAMAGLDQESGQQLDIKNFFEASLAQALADGEVQRRGLTKWTAEFSPPSSPAASTTSRRGFEAIDVAASDRTALEVAQEGIVLLKNTGILPLSGNVTRLAVIGAHADKGVLSGGGSSQVVPRGGVAASEPSKGVDGALIFDPSSPLESIRSQLPRAQVEYDDGSNPERAAKIAAKAETAIVFVDQWMTETADAPDLTLPNGQDRLVEAIVRANPRTVVVLETGGPVLMPWFGRAPAVLEAWYSGQKGGEAIADVLCGAVNPSGDCRSAFPLAKPNCRTPGCLAIRKAHRSALSGEAAAMARSSPPTTARARPSATNGSRRNRSARSFRSGLASPTRPSACAISRLSLMATA